MKYLLFLISLNLLSCQSDEKKPLGLPIQSNENTLLTIISKDTITSTSDSSTFVPFFERFLVEKEFQKERINTNIVTDNVWQSEKDFIPFLHADTLSLFEIKLKGNHKQDVILIDFKKHENWLYEFENNEDNWTLKNLKNVPKNKLSDREFIDFLTLFSKDSVFQKKHILFPLNENILDNDYEVISEKTTLKQWKYFNLNNEMESLIFLSNIEKNNVFRNIYYRGKYNGIWVKYTFKKIKNEWFLIKTEDYST